MLYVFYAIGLSLVFAQLGAKRRQAFLPVYNYYVLIRALGLPKAWFLGALIPYVGTVYSIAIAIRLGKIYGHGVAFSSTWLTFGAPAGMFILARRRPRQLAVIKEPAPHIDTKKIQRKLKKHRP